MSRKKSNLLINQLNKLCLIINTTPQCPAVTEAFEHLKCWEAEAGPAAAQTGPDSAESQNCKHCLSDSLSSVLWGASSHHQGALVEDHVKIQPEVCLEQWVVHWAVADVVAPAVEVKDFLSVALVAISVPGFAAQ